MFKFSTHILHKVEDSGSCVVPGESNIDPAPHAHHFRSKDHFLTHFCHHRHYTHNTLLGATRFFFFCFFFMFLRFLLRINIISTLWTGETLFETVVNYLWHLKVVVVRELGVYKYQPILTDLHVCKWIELNFRSTCCYKDQIHKAISMPKFIPAL